MDTGTVGDKHPDPENIRHGSINSPVGGSIIGAPATGAPAASGAASASSAGGVPGVVPTLTKTGSISGPSTPSTGSIPVGSPAKESGLQRETSAEDAFADGDAAGADAAQQGLPIRS